MGLPTAVAATAPKPDIAAKTQNASGTISFTRCFTMSPFPFACLASRQIYLTAETRALVEIGSHFFPHDKGSLPVPYG